MITRGGAEFATNQSPTTILESKPRMQKTSQLILTLLLFCLILNQSPVTPADAGRLAGSSAQGVVPPYKQYFPLIFHTHSLIPTRLGPFIGRVLAVGQDPANPATVYSMTFGSGVYKSTDYGASWAPSSVGISYLALQAMAVDPVTPNTIYAGTYGDGSVPYDGVFKSSDGGATWHQTGELANIWNGVRYNRPVVYALGVDRLNPNRVFAGTRMKYLPDGSLGGGGVFRTENGGSTWIPANTGLPNEDLYVYDLALDPSHPGRVYAALHQHGLYRSDNYGGSWYPLSGTPYAGRAVAIDPFNPSTLFFGAVKKLGIVRSTDAGAGWAQIGGGWDTMVGSLSPDPIHPGALYAGILVDNTDYYLMRSTNSGSSWGAVARLDTWGKMIFSPDGQKSITGVDFDGPYRSIDGGLTWNRSAVGLSGFSVTGLALSPASHATLYAALFGMGVFISNDRGASWADTSAGLENAGILALAADPGNASVLYATTDQSAVYRSTNGGQSWGALAGGYPQAAPAASSQRFAPFENRQLPELDVLKDNPDAPPLFSLSAATGLAAGNAIAVSPTNSSVVLVGTAGQGIYWWNGSSWAASSLSAGTVYSILFDRAKPGRALAAAGASSGGVLASANHGQTWQVSSSGLAGRTVYSLAQSQHNAAYFLAGTDSGVYQSIDGGSTWSSLGLSGQAVKAVGLLYIDHEFLFAGTDSAAYHYDSFTGAWNSLQKPFDNVGIQSIIPDPSSRSVYFVTRLGGTIRIDIQ